MQYLKSAVFQNNTTPFIYAFYIVTILAVVLAFDIVIARFAVEFEINSTHNAGIVFDCTSYDYFCIICAIHSKYHNKTCYYIY